MVVAAAVGGAVAQAADVDYQAIARRVLDDHIRPSYAALDTQAGGLKGTLEILCKDPSPATLTAAQAAFRKTVVAWSRVEHIRFGPVAVEHRYERFAFWPDQKGIGARQIAAALAEMDPSVTSLETLASKSIALQGLTALEVLLFDEGYEGLTQKDAADAFRCRFAAAIGANLAAMAAAVDKGWTGDSGFASTFLNPGPDNPVYHKPQEVIQELYMAYTTELEVLKDKKLARVLGASPQAARGKRAEFWRSAMALESMAGNVDAITALFQIAFAPIVDADFKGLDVAIVRALRRVSGRLKSIPEPLHETIAKSDVWTKLRHQVSILGALPTAASQAIAEAAGLMGLNALDGD